MEHDRRLDMEPKVFTSPAADCVAYCSLYETGVVIFSMFTKEYALSRHHQYPSGRRSAVLEDPEEVFEGVYRYGEAFRPHSPPV